MTPEQNHVFIVTLNIYETFFISSIDEFEQVNDCWMFDKMGR